MWPWEHVVVGYLAYSLLVHALARRPPTGGEAVVVAFACVLPDLIDKPLGWELGVFASGYGIAHSVLLAVPASLAVLGLAWLYDRPGLGGAFAVGYLVHLPTDVVPHYVRDGSLPVERVLWPLRSAEGSYPGGLSGTFASYFADYRAEVLTTDPNGYALGVLATMAVALVLWLYDGMPGVSGPVRYAIRRLRATVADGG